MISMATEFTLPEAPGKTVASDFAAQAGPTVILFFPLAFSGVCTAACSAFRDQWADWQGLGARVLGISVDSPFTVAKWRELERMPFPVLSDFNKETCRAYGAFHEDLMGLKGVAKRAAFVIRKDGSVAYQWVSDNPGVQVDFDAIKAAVASCR